MMKAYTVSVTPGEDGWLVAQATNLRGAITQGRDLDEVAFMIRDAIEVLTETKEFRLVLRLDPKISSDRVKGRTASHRPSATPITRRKAAGATSK